MEQRPERMDDLLRKEEYTPEELATLLEVDPHVIRRAAREGQLRATMVGDDVVSISREAALQWLASRGGTV